MKSVWFEVIDLILILTDKKLAAEMNYNNNIIATDSGKRSIVLEFTRENQSTIDFFLIAIINNQTQNRILHMIPIFILKIKTNHMRILAMRKFMTSQGLELLRHVRENRFT